MSLSAFAASEEKTETSVESKSAKPAKTYDYKGYGVQFSSSTLGFGGDFAMGLTKRSNVRVGANFFNYNRTFDKDGVSYKGKLGLKSFETLYDFFPFAGGFHLSPGVMLYNGNELSALAGVQGGNSFTMNNVEYFSESGNPLKGTGKLTTNKVAPMFLLGYGNMIPRSGRHVTFNIEAGVVFQGSPDIKLNFTGGACDQTGENCVDAATDPTFLANVAAQEKKLSDDARPFKYYPVIKFGIGYRFGGRSK